MQNEVFRQMFRYREKASYDDCDFFFEHNPSVNLECKAFIAEERKDSAPVSNSSNTLFLYIAIPCFLLLLVLPISLKKYI